MALSQAASAEIAGPTVECVQDAVAARFAAEGQLAAGGERSKAIGVREQGHRRPARS